MPILRKTPVYVEITRCWFYRKIYFYTSMCIGIYVIALLHLSGSNVARNNITHKNCNNGHLHVRSPR